MGIVKAVWLNENHSEIALVTDIGVIPFINEENDQTTQGMIDHFNDGTLVLDSRWTILDENEKAEFVDISNQFWL